MHIDDPTLKTQDAVDANSVTMGVTLAAGSPTRAAESMPLTETDEERDRRLLIELIIRRAGASPSVSSAAARRHHGGIGGDGGLANSWPEDRQVGRGPAAGDRGHATRVFVL
jgi:hypothetical protein